jgi:DNA (cytosine-5)-methyltransferase 1
MKILNLYACLGGNRYLWNEVKDDIEVTAVELDKELARLYKERFPNDKVIVADAHQYLLDHYKEYDFIWSSPPCPTHSRLNLSMKTKRKMKYPDMKLYEEIILLEYFYNGKYCVENVISYYDPLIMPKKRNRHYYWTNFKIPLDLNERKAPTICRTKDELSAWKVFYNYDFRKYKGKQDKRKIARNLIQPEAGKTIFKTLIDIKENKINQIGLFK